MKLFLTIFNDELSFDDAAFFSVAAVIIVFLILTLIIMAVNLTGKIFGWAELRKKRRQKRSEASLESDGTGNTEEITDDDMMAAVLVATIDCHEETKKDVKLKSIRRIK